MSVAITPVSSTTTAVALARAAQGSAGDQGEPGAAQQAGEAEGRQPGVGGGPDLSVAERRAVAQLQAIDRRVRAHEQAHIAAGAGVVRGGASFEYQQGPDGRRYAVAGEVPIDNSPARDPEATIAKARQIRRAALAPADPSAQDRRVAAQARAMEAEARAELREQRRAEQGGEGEGAVPAATAVRRRLDQAIAAASDRPVRGALLNAQA